MTAEDVRWSLAQITGEKSSAYLRGQLAEIQSVETPDARTVLIVMKAPAVTLPLILATPFAPIIAKASLGAEGGPVGAGPYVLKAQERGVSIDLVAFDKFYRPGRPRLKQVRMLAYADENARVAALQAGDVDMIEYVPWQSMQQIEADAKLKAGHRGRPIHGARLQWRHRPVQGCPAAPCGGARHPARRGGKGGVLRAWHGARRPADREVERVL